MKRKQKALTISVLLAALFLSGCSGQTAAPASSAAAPASAAAASTAAPSGEKIKLALAVPSLDNPYFIEVANSFKAKCAELGAEAVVSDSQYDAAEQYNQFENYIAMGVKGIYVCPVDQKSLQEVTDEAKQAGISVIGFAQGVDNATSNFVLDDYQYGVVNGQNAAKWINEKYAGKAEVLLITLDHVESVKLRGDGMEDTIKKECPESTIVARQYAEDMATAMKITETVLQSNPNVRVIACVNDQHALGALEAVTNMGIKDDNFYIGGADYTAEAIAKMKEAGSYFRVTADIQPGYYGAYGAQKLYEYATQGSKEENELMNVKAIWATDLT